jgi:hypothetical protein
MKKEKNTKNTPQLKKSVPKGSIKKSGFIMSREAPYVTKPKPKAAPKKAEKGYKIAGPLPKLKAPTPKITSQSSGYQSRFAPGNVPLGYSGKIKQTGTDRTITYRAMGKLSKATPLPKKKNPFAKNTGRNR